MGGTVIIIIIISLIDHVHSFLSWKPVLQKALENTVHEYVLKQWAKGLPIDCSLNMYISVF